jgi:hypothetical protein
MWVTRDNLYSVDRLLAQPDPAASLRIRMLGKDEARLLLRYEVSEQNRYYGEIWEIAQVVLGALFFFFLLFGTTEGKVSLALGLVLLVLILLQRFLLAPELKALGKLLDFGPVSLLHGERARYRVVNAAYAGVELGKWIIQLALAGLLIGRRRPRSGNAGK